METVNCGIDDSKGQLSYDRSAKELASCKDKDFSFNIQPSGDGDGQSVAIFEISKDGAVVRRNTSKPFATGALTKKGMSVNKVNCNVTLKKHSAVNLNDYGF